MQLVSSLFLEGSSTLYPDVTFLRSLQGKAISGYPWCGHESVLWPEKYLEPTDPSKSSLCLFSIYAPSPPHTPSPIFWSFSPISSGRGPWVPTVTVEGVCIRREKEKETGHIHAAWVIFFKKPNQTPSSS